MKYGNDVIYGEELLVDNIYGDTNGDIAEGKGGNDQIFGLGGSILRGQGDSLYGDAENLRGSAQGGNDLIDGGSFADLLQGDAANQMFDQSQGGNDHLIGGLGNDTARGDAGRLTDQAQGGNDRLEGNEGNDNLYGDATFLAGSSRGGDDVLDGGAGNDQLWGDAQFLQDQAQGGQDLFVFADVFGDDTVHDFRSGEDLLQFSAPGVDGMEDLSIAVLGADTVITVEGFGSVTLLGVAGGIGAGDIVFA